MKSRAGEIAFAFGFSLSHDLGKCLGVPLQHNKTLANSLVYITNKLMHRLSSWKASSLSLAGRLTLCKSVILAIPSYLMQTTYPLSKVCDSIDKVCRNFLWVN